MLKDIHICPNSKVVNEIIRASKTIAMPPQKSCIELETMIARYYEINVNRVLVGVGSSDLLNMLLMQNSRGKQKTVIMSKYTFFLYEQLANLYEYKIIKIDTRFFIHDLTSMMNSITGENEYILIIDSPHNIFGTCVNEDEIFQALSLLKSNVTVIYDNVYGEYQDKNNTSFLKMILKSNLFSCNVLLLKSFSKIYRMFGLRVGYMLGDEIQIAKTRKYVLPYNISNLSYLAAIESFKDKDFLMKCYSENQRGKQKLENCLTKLNISYIKTQSHNILINFREKFEIIHGLFKKARIKHRLFEDLKDFIQIEIITIHNVNRVIKEITRAYL